MKVSVIMPTHNRSELLISAIDSVLNQSYKNFEIIVISDGSTDNTDKLIEKYMLKEHRIKYISYAEPVNGNYARNLGIKNAQGDIITFLDDDDTWLANKLEKQVAMFKKNQNVGLVTTGVYYNYINERISYKSIPKVEGDVSKRIMISNCIGGTQVAVRKSILDRSGYFDENLTALQDYDLWIRVAQLTLIASVELPLINYTNIRSKKQVSKNTKNYENALIEIENKYKYLLDNLTKNEKRKREIAMTSLIANKYMRNDDRSLAIRYLVKTFVKYKSIKIISLLFLSFFKYETILKFRKVMSKH